MMSWKIEARVHTASYEDTLGQTGSKEVFFDENNFQIKIFFFLTKRW